MTADLDPQTARAAGWFRIPGFRVTRYLGLWDERPRKAPPRERCLGCGEPFLLFADGRCGGCTETPSRDAKAARYCPGCGCDLGEVLDRETVARVRSASADVNDAWVAGGMYAKAVRWQRVIEHRAKAGVR